MKNHFVFSLLLFFSLTNVFGQNLVPNNSFENGKYPPCNWVQDRIEFSTVLLDWQMPTKGTPDLWDMDNDPTCRLSLALNQDLDFNSEDKPQKLFFEQVIPFDGDAILGLITRNNALSEGKYTEYREYAMVELRDSLVKGQKYYFQMHAAWAKGCKFSSNGLGVALTNHKIMVETDSNLDSLMPLVHFDKILNADSTIWHKLSKTFEAQGGEKYLIIGNFFDNKHTKTKQESSYKDYQGDAVKEMSYYFVDDVILMDNETFLKQVSALNFAPLDTLAYADAPLEELNQEKLVQKKVILENILFPVNQSKLLPASQKTLNVLFKKLNENKNLNVLIIGHTDNQGNAAHNEKLSLDRANAVKDFLVQKGIENSRIRTEGYGDRQPLMSNETEEGKMKNRRVEASFGL
jgi:outer membrane protein OmpA-like peptidoglycan-associated protein